MNRMHVAGLLGLVFPVLVGAILPGGSSQGDNVSFREDVAPLLQKYCLPCHAEENDNPSELALDSYSSLMKGGKHGVVVVPGAPEESSLIQKLSETPPFGERMPMHSRRAKSTVPPRYLTEEEVRVVSQWVAQGGKDN
jgi:hypothetical protein